MWVGCHLLGLVAVLSYPATDTVVAASAVEAAICLGLLQIGARARAASVRMAKAEQYTGRLAGGAADPGHTWKSAAAAIAAHELACWGCCCWGCAGAG